MVYYAERYGTKHLKDLVIKNHDEGGQSRE